MRALASARLITMLAPPTAPQQDAGTGMARAALAQLVRALDCGSRGPPFDPGRRYHPESRVLLLFCGLALALAQLLLELALQGGQPLHKRGGRIWLLKLFLYCFAHGTRPSGSPRESEK